MSDSNDDDNKNNKSIDDKTQEIIEMLKEAGVSTETLAEDHAFWDTQVRLDVLVLFLFFLFTPMIF